MSKSRAAVINLMLLLFGCLRPDAVVAINTLWLVVFLPVSVSFWFPAWEKRVNMRQESGETQSGSLASESELLIIVSSCFVGNKSGVDECTISQS